MSQQTTNRWHGVERPYSEADVARLRGSVHIEYSLARLGAEKFWRLLHSEPVVAGLGCMTGNQAIQTVQAGLKAIYCSGWQVAGDANSAGEVYPDQSLYPVDSVPKMVERINNALLRTDQIHHMDGKPRHRLAGSHHRRCRGRLRRQPQRLRADQGADPRRRRGGAFRRSAVVRQEVRPPGRQGAGLDRRGHQQAGGGAPRGRRHGRAHGDHRTHRRRRGRPAADRS